MPRPFVRGTTATSAATLDRRPHRALTPRPTVRASTAPAGSFAERYRGTPYETPLEGVTAAAPMARGRLFVLLSAAAVASAAAIVAMGG